MLCFPIEKKPDWRKPPVITLFLIIINVFCYLAFQLDDGEESQEAFEYYFSSGLAKIELPRFYSYLTEEYEYSDVVEIKTAKEKFDNEDFEKFLFSYMHRDGVFLSNLQQDKIITVNDTDYKQWKLLRKNMDEKWDAVTYYRYGIKPSQDNIETYFSSMFLHGGFGHLFGNMIFLFLFGFIVEMAIGWKIYLPAYIVAGLGSGLLYVVMESNSAIPGIGASGAIAGLAGMYTVLFGLRKVRFFVYLFFYFDTLKLPAIIMLPVWIGYEFFNHFYTDSGVNNLAHAGGYITGAIIIAAMKFSKKTVNVDFLDEENKKEDFERNYKQAQQYLAALEFDKAARVFKKLEQIKPDDLNIRQHLYNISKTNPTSEDFHNYAQAILSVAKTDEQTVKLQKEVFIEYVTKAKPGPRLNATLMTRLALRFAKYGFLDEADKIVKVLLKNKIKNNELVDLLVLLIKSDKSINHNRSKLYLAELTRRAPEKAQQLAI